MLEQVLFLIDPGMQFLPSQSQQSSAQETPKRVAKEKKKTRRFISYNDFQMLKRKMSFVIVRLLEGPYLYLLFNSSVQED